MQHHNSQVNQLPLKDSPNSSIFAQSPGSIISSGTSQPNLLGSTQSTVAEAVVNILENLGVRHGFGVSGGAIASLWASLEQSQIEVMHFRHESGAAFAAAESYLANNRPVVIFTTTGPGITNALTGLLAARWEGAKVILVSAATAAPQRGRWAFQETSTYTMPAEVFCADGTLFNYAKCVETGDELAEVSRRLASGLANPGAFIAHISIPTIVQSSLLNAPLAPTTFSQSRASVGEEAIVKSIQLLSSRPFAIWLGFGAREAAAEIRQLAERTGAAVMTSPRGKGVFPENHPQYIGVTGFGGHSSVMEYMRQNNPERILVLGTRLGEFTSFWSPAMIPSGGFIHVDIDPKVPGTAYPDVETFSIQSDIQAFVRALLTYFPKRPLNPPVLPNPERQTVTARESGLVRPKVLMDTIQRLLVEGSDALVMTEAGNSFAWGTNTLRFAKPGRYRVSTGFGSMGHAATGILGAAVARNSKAVAILGDGAMLMNNEVSTAVKYQIPAVWIVLNDSRYNMCAQGMKLLGLQGVDTEIAAESTDFVAIAKAMGADGIRVEKETDLDYALETALATKQPFVVDVIIDPNQTAPFGNRIQSLKEQGAQ